MAAIPLVLAATAPAAENFRSPRRSIRVMAFPPYHPEASRCIGGSLKPTAAWHKPAPPIWWGRRLKGQVELLVPQCQCALLLKQQEAPSELDHAAADPSVAGSGEPLFPPLGAALVRRASQTGVARHRFSVTHGPQEHLMGGCRARGRAVVSVKWA